MKRSSLLISFFALFALLVGCANSSRMSIKHNAFVPKSQVCTNTDNGLKCFDIKNIMGLETKTIFDKPDGEYEIFSNLTLKISYEGKKESVSASSKTLVSIKDDTVSFEAETGTIIVNKKTGEVIECPNEETKDMMKNIGLFRDFPLVSSGDVLHYKIRMGGIKTRIEGLIHGITTYNNKPHLFMEIRGKVSMLQKGNSIRGNMTGFFIVDLENMSVGIYTFDMTLGSNKKGKAYIRIESSIQ